MFACTFRMLEGILVNCLSLLKACCLWSSICITLPCAIFGGLLRALLKFFCKMILIGRFNCLHLVIQQRTEPVHFLNLWHSTSHYWYNTGFVLRRESNCKGTIFLVFIYNVLHDFNFKCSTWTTFLFNHNIWNVSPPCLHPVHSMLLTAHSNQIQVCKNMATLFKYRLQNRTRNFWHSLFIKYNTTNDKKKHKNSTYYIAGNRTRENGC